MGLVKKAWLKEQEQGWSEPDTFVCDRCVRDTFLIDLIRQSAQERHCDYCQRRGRGAIAAPAGVVIQAIAAAIGRSFNDPNNAGVPWDGGYIIEPIDTHEMLQSLPLDCSDEFFAAVEEAFGDAVWVPAAEGHWNSSHLGERMRYSWNSFVQTVKHRTRYHFARQPPSDREELSAEELLSAIGGAVERLKLCRQLPEGTTLHRVRVRASGETWLPNAGTMGAPPNERAKAGRMNPAGISYFYGALEAATAIAETVSSPPIELVMAEFVLNRDIHVLDLSHLPDDPSIFEVARHDDLQWLRFLRSFATAISEPVRKDGNEHVDYVPSQVVSEWFAQVFAPEHTTGRLHGVLYPSAIAPGGRNLVLFPDLESHPRAIQVVTFDDHDEFSLKTWAELAAALGFEMRPTPAAKRIPTTPRKAKP